MKKLELFALLLPGLLLPAAAPAQPKIELCQFYKDQVMAIQAVPAGDARKPAISAILRPDQHAACVAFAAVAMAQSAESRFTRAFEAARTDKQAGASAGGGGGTSLISKGVTAKALSVATEYGALTEAVSGQVVTVSGSLDGVPGALIRGRLAAYCLGGLPLDQQRGCISKSSLNLLRRISYSASFDTSRNSQTLTGQPASGTSTGTTPTTPVPVTFTPSGHQLSAITTRFEIWNQRDATSTTYIDAWAKRVQDTTNGKSLSDAANVLLTVFEQAFPDNFRQDAGYTAWFNQSAAILAIAPNVEKAWTTQLTALLGILQHSSTTPTVAQNFLDALSRYDMEQDALIDAAADKAVFTFEYDNNRPVGQDSNSNFRIIFDKGFGKHWSFTANAAINVWDRDQSTPNTKISRLRDVQAGAEIDYKLGALGKLASAASIDGSYYFQYQNSAILLKVDPTQPLPGINFTGLPSGAAAVLADTGAIHIGQLKLVLGTGSSIRVPISFTYSNRSELVPKPN
jgi:hypothetical protein